MFSWQRCVEESLHSLEYDEAMNCCGLMPRTKSDWLMDKCKRKLLMEAAWTWDYRADPIRATSRVRCKWTTFIRSSKIGRLLIVIRWPEQPHTESVVITQCTRGLQKVLRLAIFRYTFGRENATGLTYVVLLVFWENFMSSTWLSYEMQFIEFKAVITIAIRLRYNDATTHSTTTEVIEITIRLRYNHDARARLFPFHASKKLTSIFRRSLVVVESQLWPRLNA